jgi:hypothetical protein
VALIAALTDVNELALAINGGRREESFDAVLVLVISDRGELFVLHRRKDDETQPRQPERGG